MVVDPNNLACVRRVSVFIHSTARVRNNYRWKHWESRDRKTYKKSSSDATIHKLNSTGLCGVPALQKHPFKCRVDGLMSTGMTLTIIFDPIGGSGQARLSLDTEYYLQQLTNHESMHFQPDKRGCIVEPERVLDAVWLFGERDWSKTGQRPLQNPGNKVDPQIKTKMQTNLSQRAFTFSFIYYYHGRVVEPTGKHVL